MDTKERSRQAAGRRKSTTQKGRRTPQQQRPGTQKRSVRPPREEIPEVAYTPPKPFNRASFLLKLVSVAAVVVALVMCMSLFFRVETILVAGAETYTAWQIREASGIEEGESLLGLSRAAVAGRIQDRLPYVDRTKVTISLPGTVQIDVTELEIAYAIADSTGGWWLISAEGRVVESVTAEDATEYTQVLGVQVEVPNLNETVKAAQNQPEESTEDDGWNHGEVETVQNTQRLQAALDILSGLEANGIINGVRSVDVTDVDNLTMNYDDRFTVVLGDSGELDYKIGYMVAAVNQLEDYQSGQLDVSFRYSDQALLTQETD